CLSTPGSLARLDSLRGDPSDPDGGCHAATATFRPAPRAPALHVIPCATGRRLFGPGRRPGLAVRAQAPRVARGHLFRPALELLRRGDTMSAAASRVTGLRLFGPALKSRRVGD